MQFLYDWVFPFYVPKLATKLSCCPFLACCCAGELRFLWATLSWPTVVQESCGFFGLNSFLACCCAGELRFLWATLSWPTVVQESCGFFGLHRSTSWCLVFSFLPRSCFCCQIYQLFFWFSLHTQVYISRLYKVQTL